MNNTIAINPKIPTQRPLIIAGIIIGLGQGGFFDGIVFHQLLQWHHLFSSVKTSQTVAGLELNTVGDGLFQLFDWLMTLIGIYLLWQVAQREDIIKSSQVFWGSVLIGSGLFNVIEGILDHHLFQIHHVKPGPNQLIWDLGFIAVGLLLCGIGWGLVSAFKQRLRSV